MTIVCQYYSRESNRNGLCSLGWYGGIPYAGNCQECLKKGLNTPEAYRKAQEKYERTHPEPFRGVSGCCDSSKNYPKSA